MIHRFKCRRVFQALASAIGTIVMIHGSMAVAWQEPKTESDIVFESDFSSDHERWTFTDKAAWKLTDEGLLSLHQKASNYKPPHRSPLHIALFGATTTGSFSMDVSVRSTHEDYGHRDVCLFFGYQGPDKFYYVHLGKVADEHCNQIFIVNESDRKKISATSNAGTPWDDQWHQVRIERDVDSGEIRVYFDDMTTPSMTANDKTFIDGQFGLGSFDDTADFDNLVIRSGVK